MVDNEIRYLVRWEHTYVPANQYEEVDKDDVLETTPEGDRVKIQWKSTWEPEESLIVSARNKVIEWRIKVSIVSISHKTHSSLYVSLYVSCRLAKRKKNRLRKYTSAHSLLKTVKNRKLGLERYFSILNETVPKRTY